MLCVGSLPVVKTVSDVIFLFFYPTVPWPPTLPHVPMPAQHRAWTWPTVLPTWDWRQRNIVYRGIKCPQSINDWRQVLCRRKYNSTRPALQLVYAERKPNQTKTTTTKPNIKKTPPPKKKNTKKKEKNKRKLKKEELKKANPNPELNMGTKLGANWIAHEWLGSSFLFLG